MKQYSTIEELVKDYLDHSIFNNKAKESIGKLDTEKQISILSGDTFFSLDALKKSYPDVKDQIKFLLGRFPYYDKTDAIKKDQDIINIELPKNDGDWYMNDTCAMHEYFIKQTSENKPPYYHYDSHNPNIKETTPTEMKVHEVDKQKPNK